MRLFVAVNFPQQERERIHQAVRRLREAEMPVRWVGEADLHVTLKFLGEVPRERLEEVEEAMARVASTTRTFATTFGGLGAFPSIRRPRVIWLGVGASPELTCLKQGLERTFGDFGFEAETRAFHPHVTLGRVGDDRGAGVLRGLQDAMTGVELGGEVEVDALHLMSSRLGPKGAKYEVVASARLLS